jgi:c-di-GMP-binding flagellar brake protein YcgR
MPNEKVGRSVLSNSREGLRNIEQDESKPRIGIINFERRKHPRFNVDLPVEYTRMESTLRQTGKALNASEGGLLIYFPERMEIGQQLRVKLYFSAGTDLESVECFVEVVWVDIHLGESWGDHRSGVKFVDVSSEDLNKIRKFLKSLSEG